MGLVNLSDPAPTAPGRLPLKLFQRLRPHPRAPPRYQNTPGEFVVWVLVPPSLGRAITGQIQLTCQAGEPPQGVPVEGGLARWAGAENVKLQAHCTRRPGVAVAAGMRRSEWSRRAPL